MTENAWHQLPTLHATLSDGTKLAYLDSHPPSASNASLGPKKTIVLIHGATLNKHCWDPLFQPSFFNGQSSTDSSDASQSGLQHLAPLLKDTRVLAYSQRGYDSSTCFTEGQKQCSDPPESILEAYASDFKGFVKVLGLGDREYSVVAWSKGGIIPLASFSPLFSSTGVKVKKGLTGEREGTGTGTWARPESVIFFEPPLSAVWGLPTDTTGSQIVFPTMMRAFSKDTDVTAQEARTQLPMLFGGYVGGFYHHDTAFLTTRGKGSEAALKSGENTFIPDSYEGQGEEKMARIGNCLSRCSQPEFIATILYTHFPGSPHATSYPNQDQEPVGTMLNASVGTESEESQYGYAREAMNSLVQEGVDVGVLFGEQAVPECIRGSWVCEDLVHARNGKVKVAQVPGGNHMMMMHVPRAFWNAVLELDTQ